MGCNFSSPSIKRNELKFRRRLVGISSLKPLSDTLNSGRVGDNLLQRVFGRRLSAAASCPAVPAVTAYEHMSVFPRAGGHTAAIACFLWRCPKDSQFGMDYFGKLQWAVGSRAVVCVTYSHLGVHEGAETLKSVEVYLKMGSSWRLSCLCCSVWDRLLCWMFMGIKPLVAPLEHCALM